MNTTLLLVLTGVFSLLELAILGGVLFFYLRLRRSETLINEGDTLFIEKLDVNAGDSVVFDQVLAIVDGENTKFGAPVVEGAKVDATVVKNGKGKKIRIFKYTPKKGYRKRQGHRQPYTKVEIGKITF